MFSEDGGIGSAVTESFYSALDALLGIVSAIGGVWPTLLLLLLAVVMPASLGAYILGPISRAGGRLAAPTRFMLGDFLWLSVHLQFVLWFCVRFITTKEMDYFLIILSGLSLVTVTTWAGAVSFASRAGVTRTSRRVVFVLVHLPTTLALMIGASFMILTMYLLATSWLSDELRFQLEFLVDLIGMRNWQVYSCIAALPFAAFGLRRAAKWILTEQPTTVLAMEA